MAKLVCTKCAASLPIDSPVWRCPECGSPLDISRLIGTGVLCEAIMKDQRGMWRYSPSLPFSSQPITLGEGGTPMIRAEYSGIDLLLKLEFVSPTGSFKDRGASMSVTRAVALGAKRVVEDSTGNAGVAASAYAARAGISSRIYVPKDAPEAKKALIKASGSELIECNDRAEAAERATSELGCGDLYIGHAWDPFYILGMETVAFEIYEHYGVPDSIVVPVASGTLLLGLYKGFLELAARGAVGRMPRIFGVQGEDCAPIYEAIHGPVAKTHGSMLADGLRIQSPPRKAEILEAIKSTGGDVFVVSDPEIAEGLRHLLRMGVIAEPTSATAFAALSKFRGSFGGVVLVPITGSGIKHPEGIAKALRVG
ncbi:MAG: pyridoxal-phosphate dependent enzyme [Candidatus Methanosuratincola petrocarbonis]